MIITNIVKDKVVKIYLHKDIQAIRKFPQGVTVVKNCQDADLVILSTLKNLPSSCASKMLFGTKYSHLQDSRVIGSFFWQKGRPNILFYKSRLDEHHILLPNSFEKYVEGEE